MGKELKSYIKIIDSHRKYLREKYNVKTIGIFGSVARGEKKTNDIDILVGFTEPIGLFAFVGLQYFLKKILKKKVDLATKGALKPLIKKNILKDTVYV